MLSCTTSRPRLAVPSRRSRCSSRRAAAAAPASGGPARSLECAGRARLDRHPARRPPARLRLQGRRDAGDRPRCSATRSCSRTPTPTRRSRFPSHASLLTGLLPPEHGVRNNIGYGSTPKHETLASVLRARGYATGAAVSAFVLRRATGLDAGLRLLRRGGRRPAGAKAVGEVQRDGPDDRGARAHLAARRGRPALLPLRPPLRAAHALDAARGRARPLRRDLRRRDRGRRRGARRSCSTGCARSASTTRRSSCCVSDHGEGLGDHGEAEHGILLYREALHVPLLVKLPRGRARREPADGARGTARRRTHDRGAARRGAAQAARTAATCSTPRAPRRPRSTARPTTRGSTSAGASCARSWTRATT